MTLGIDRSREKSYLGHQPQCRFEFPFLNQEIRCGRLQKETRWLLKIPKTPANRSQSSKETTIGHILFLCLGLWGNTPPASHIHGPSSIRNTAELCTVRRKLLRMDNKWVLLNLWFWFIKCARLHNSRCHVLHHYAKCVCLTHSYYYFYFLFSP
jgi:hypothetical protein